MKSIVLVGLALAITGCNQNSDVQNHPDKAANAPADNTKVNERDRGGGSLTPGDQGENERDRTITQQVRQAVIKDDTLSMDGKNIKIITRDSVVTLRGPVRSEKEKTDIGALAQRVENVKRVDNQLEVTPP